MTRTENYSLPEVCSRMINVHDHAHSLARALKQSQELLAFRAARDKVMARSSAKEMLADFEKKRLELQALAVQGIELTAEQQEGFQKLYDVIALDPDLQNYLQAEARLGQLLGDIYRIIGEAVDVQPSLT